MNPVVSPKLLFKLININIRLYNRAVNKIYKVISLESTTG
jgi:hypothetical protein